MNKEEALRILSIHNPMAHDTLQEHLEDEENKGKTFQEVVDQVALRLGPASLKSITQQPKETDNRMYAQVCCWDCGAAVRGRDCKCSEKTFFKKKEVTSDERKLKYLEEENKELKRQLEQMKLILNARTELAKFTPGDMQILKGIHEDMKQLKKP